ncbi:MAG: hypothetical protein AAF808_09535 [Cyanobacteria bacterium P01_D01_bin.2]
MAWLLLRGLRSYAARAGCRRGLAVSRIANPLSAGGVRGLQSYAARAGCRRGLAASRIANPLSAGGVERGLGNAGPSPDRSDYE